MFDSFDPAHPKAYVTLCTTDAYAIGVSVLASSLRARQIHASASSSSSPITTFDEPTFPIYTLVPHGTLSQKTREFLLQFVDGLIFVKPILSVDQRALVEMGRVDLYATFTKLYLWSLVPLRDQQGKDALKDLTDGMQFMPSPHSTFAHFHKTLASTGQVTATSTDTTGVFSGAPGFERVVYLDADMLFLQSIDELLTSPSYEHVFAACPDIGWPDTFNSGLMVLQPNANVFRTLFSMASQPGSSFDGADQGLLNMYYSDWCVDDNMASSSSSPGRRSKRLSFLYNVCIQGRPSYTYGPAFRHFASQIKGVHFLGAGNKPWQARQTGDAASSKWILPSGPCDTDTLPNYLSLWWQLYQMRVGSHVDQLGGLSVFSVFGGTQTAQGRSQSGPSRTSIYSPFSPSFAGSDDSFAGRHRGPVAWGSDMQRNASSPGAMHPQAADLSNYRIQWNPQIEKLFEKPRLSTDVKNAGTGYSSSSGSSHDHIRLLNRSEDELDALARPPVNFKQKPSKCFLTILHRAWLCIAR